MCFTKRFKTRKEARNFKNNPKIAKKDIPVYKVIHKTGFSAIKGFDYCKGFHYTELNPFKGRIKRHDFLFHWLLDIETGFHSCKSIQEAKKWGLNNKKLVTFYIPKGAKYYENDTEYVSDQIVWY